MPDDLVAPARGHRDRELALITKEVYLSLFAGILAGAIVLMIGALFFMKLIVKKE